MAWTGCSLAIIKTNIWFQGSVKVGQIECLFRFKLRRAQYEHMFSALPLNADIAEYPRHAKVPVNSRHSK
jgi:hypothetical protein